MDALTFLGSYSCQTPPCGRRCRTPPGRRRFQPPPPSPPAGGGARHPPAGGGAKFCKLFLTSGGGGSSDNATLIFSSVSQPHLSQTVRCGTSRQLAMDTCDGGFVQTHVFSRRVVRVLALGIHTARFHMVGVIFARVSGPLRDWDTARRNSPTDLEHTQLPAAKKGGVTRRHKLTHNTAQ